ncbi:MAG: PQQ-like beta-propeller repeat protein [Gammaproteobacteria bacterium]|nr:PQQ-like beta-propeller repeat protein [Gammaproteobacteria bacterium]
MTKLLMAKSSINRGSVVGWSSWCSRLYTGLLASTVWFGLLTAAAASAAEMVLVYDAPLPVPSGASGFEIQAFSALPDKLFQPGDTAGLSWSVPGAKTVTLLDNSDGTRLEGLRAQGVVRVAPTATTTSTLSAKGPAGTESAQLHIVVASEEPKNLWNDFPRAQQQRGKQLLRSPEAIGTSLTALEDGTVYQGSFDGNYYRFSAEGALIWTLEGVGVVMNQAAVTDKLVFVGANNAEGGHIFALKPDQSLLWEVHTDSGMIASPILNADNSLVYAASYNGTILGLNTADGNEQWRYQLPDGDTVTAAPTLSEDGSTLYIHNTDNKIYAVSTEPPIPVSPKAKIIALPDGPVLVLKNNAPPQKKAALIWERDLKNQN